MDRFWGARSRSVEGENDLFIGQILLPHDVEFGEKFSQIRPRFGRQKGHHSHAKTIMATLDGGKPVPHGYEGGIGG
jgi:hypothetical protein